MKRLILVTLIPFFLAGCLEEEPKTTTNDDKPAATVDVHVNINNNKEEQPSSRERLRNTYAK